MARRTMMPRAAGIEHVRTHTMMVCMVIETEQTEPEVAKTIQGAFLAHPPSHLWVTFDDLSDADAAKAWTSIDSGGPGIAPGAKRN